MTQQVGVTAEAAATLCARVGPGSCVHQHVTQEVAAAAEALAALQALLWWLCLPGRRGVSGPCVSG